MLIHCDGDKEYYSPKLTTEDQNAIFKILDKYGDNNDSIRGELAVHEVDNERIVKLSEYLVDICDPYEIKDIYGDDFTYMDVAREVINDPIGVIEFLLDTIQEAQLEV